MAKDFGGYLTVIKTSSEYDYGEAIFTVDKVRLIISEKVKQSFDPKRIFKPRENVIEEFNANKIYRRTA